MKSRVLIYDIETSYLVTKTWGIYESNAIGQGKGIIKDFQILCFSYKWLDEGKVYAVSQTDFKNYEPGVNNDFNVVKKLRDLFNEADIVIAHNGNQFDQRKARARMIYHNLIPHTPIFQIDTKLVARRHFGFTSNKLDDLAAYFGIPGKLNVGGIETWDGCLEGDKKAWRRMIKYNKQDVVVLELVYLKMLGWMTTHPNLANISDKPDVCPYCESEGPFEDIGVKRTPMNKYRMFRCLNCQSSIRDTKAIKSQRPSFTT